MGDLLHFSRSEADRVLIAGIRKLQTCKTGEIAETLGLVEWTMRIFMQDYVHRIVQVVAPFKIVTKRLIETTFVAEVKVIDARTEQIIPGGIWTLEIPARLPVDPPDVIDDKVDKDPPVVLENDNPCLTDAERNR